MGITRVDVDRASAEDLMSLVPAQATASAQVGAVLLFEPGDAQDPLGTSGTSIADDLVATIARRLPAVPRLRQRLFSVRRGLGRPVWVDDPAFELAHHLAIRPVPGDLDALLAFAAELLMTPLSLARPLWTAAVVPGTLDRPPALVFVFHHVLADGIAGLRILIDLATADVPDDAPFPVPRPSDGRLAADARRSRVRALRQLPARLATVGQAVVQLGPFLFSRVPRTSLNRPVGRTRRFVLLTGDLDSLRDAGRAAGATVNDVLLTAVAGALRELSASRGERLDEVVLSVPFSARRDDSAGELGNRSGVIPIRVPAAGGALLRLKATVDATRAAKRTRRDASTALLGPGFRALARLGLYQAFIDRQRAVQSFVTDIVGPPVPLGFGPFGLERIIPLTVAAGNVTVAFAAMSYAGSVTVTIVVDPEACPDVEVVRDALARELSALTGSRWR